MGPKVSVCLVTYNHEKFIKQAIESVFMQKTDFDYEVVIGEDYSTDNTRKILSQYQMRYPHRIKAIFNNKNVGPVENFIRTLSTCKGKYIAYLEGDDYWTDRYKLQKQVDFLDKHPDYSLCFHPVEAFYQDQSDKTYLIPSKTENFNFKSLLQQNFIAACSVMYRHGIVKEIPDWFLSLNIGDWPYHLLHAFQGEIGFINQAMARYRRHSNSYCSQPKVKNFQNIIEFYQVIDKHFHYKYRSIIKFMIGKHYLLIAQEQFQDHKIKTARESLNKAYQHLGPIKALTNKDWLKIFLKSRLVPCPV